MPDMSLILVVIILALTFDFINGFHDTANAIATCVSTRAIRPGVAIVGTAILNFVGAMISTGVAKTIGGDIVMSPDLVNEMVIISGLIGAIIWNLITWWFGMPSSSSHALIGGMIGAVVILTATMLHLPVSTTHVVSGSIFSAQSFFLWDEPVSTY